MDRFGFITLDDYLKNTIETRAKYYKGDVVGLANSLGVSKSTLYRFFNRLGRPAPTKTKRGPKPKRDRNSRLKRMIENGR